MTFALREVETDVRQELDRRIEQCGTVDAFGRKRRELEDEPASVGVPDPDCALDARGVERLEDVVHVRCDRPGRLPLGVAVRAEIRCEHAEAVGQALLGEPAKAPAMGIEAVQAHDHRGSGVAPLVQVELHQPSWASAPTTASGSP